MDKGTLDKIIAGLSDKNIRFADLRKLMLNLGFEERTRGNHHIFTKGNVAEIINMQSLKDGKAKAYQVKQIRGIILRYKLHQEVNDV